MQEFRDPLFKGCTVPAMIIGIPIMPFSVVVGAIMLLSIYTSLLVSIVLVPILYFMREIAKKDDQQYRLLHLKMLFRVPYFFKNASFWKASAYSPMQFTKRRK